MVARCRGLRLDAALLHGASSDAYDEIVAGRTRAQYATWTTSRTGVSSPRRTPLGRHDRLPFDMGRADLDGPQLTARLDAFLQAAIDRVQA